MRREFTFAGRKFSPGDIVAGAALIALGGAFVYAGALKLGAPQSLADAIDGYGLPVGPLTNPAALVLPPLEILAGLALAVRRWRGPALLVLGALCVVFLAALLQAAARGLVVDCGCFGSEAPSSAGMARAIARDLVMLGAIVALYGRKVAKLPAAASSCETCCEPA